MFVAAACTCRKTGKASGACPAAGLDFRARRGDLRFLMVQPHCIFKSGLYCRPAAGTVSGFAALMRRDAEKILRRKGYGTFMKRLLVCDFDGTLYRRGYERQFAEACVRIAKAPDVVFAVASGRPLHLLRPYFESMRGIYIISNDGALITRDGEVLYQRPVDKRTVAEVFASYGGTLVGYGRLLSFVRCPDPAAMRRMQAQYRHHVLRVAHAGEIFGDVYKLCLHGDYRPAGLTACYDSYALHEYVAQGVHKGTAVRYLKQLLGLTCVAVGDGKNDMELLREAERSYAVAWAPPQVKALADAAAADILDVLRRERL